MGEWMTLIHGDDTKLYVIVEMMCLSRKLSSFQIYKFFFEIEFLEIEFFGMKIVKF